MLSTLLFAAASAIVLVPAALARAGGGSNGGGKGGILTLIFLPFAMLYVWWKNKRIADKNVESERLLAKLALKDPEWEESRVLLAASKNFLAVQKAWCDQDLPALRDLMGPAVYEDWAAKLTALQAKGWTNRMDRLTIFKMRVVEVQNYRDRLRDAFTVCIDAAAEDYTVDRSGTVVESNTSDDKKRAAKQKSFEPFREFWTYRRRENGWILQRVDEDGDWAKSVNAKLVDEDSPG
jgi:hypothetical protein